MKLLQPLRHRDFRYLWFGMSTSLVGDGVLLVALAWQVYLISNAVSAMSAVGVALTAPQVATLLVGGVVADRIDRRVVLVVADLVRGLCLLVLTILAARGRLTLPEVYLLVGIYGAGTGFFGPAFDAIVPGLVPADELEQANALDQFVRPVAARIAGPAIGGVLLSLGGPQWALGVDAMTFAVSVFCVAAMRRPASTPSSGSASVWHEAVTGIRYVAGRPWLWATFLAATFTYLLFLGPTEVLLPYLIKNVMHGSGADLGLVLTAGGIGALLAAVVVGQRGIPLRDVTFIYVTWSLATLAVAGYGLAVAGWQLAVFCALINGLEAAGTIAWATLKARLVEPALRGRVSSLDWFISIALLPASYALTAPVAQAIGARATLVLAGVLGAGITGVFLLVPGVRDVQRVRPKVAV
jgi:Transmembrane secretion effector